MRWLTLYILILMPLFVTANLALEPTLSPSNLSFSQDSPYSFIVSWDAGDGGNRVVIMKNGGPVTFSPFDGWGFPLNAQLAAGEFVVLDGSANSVRVTREGDAGLQIGATYYFAVYEYNSITGYLTNNFLLTPLTGSFVFGAETGGPSIGASDLSFTNIQRDRMTVNWSRGNGDGCIVLAYPEGSVSDSPIQNANYQYYQTLPNGARVVYKGSGSSFIFSTIDEGKNKLTLGVRYYFRVIEYSSSPAGVVYANSLPLEGSEVTIDLATEPASGVTSCVTQARYQELDGSGKERSKIELNWNDVACDGYLVVARANQPVDLSSIPADGVLRFKDYDLGGGNFVAHVSSQSATEFKQEPSNNYMLQYDTEYHFAIVPYNGWGNSINYNTTSVFTYSEYTLPVRPSMESSNIDFTYVSDEFFDVEWVKGNGENSLVIASESPITFTPSNEQEYSVGDEPLSGQFVVYTGDLSAATVNDLNGVLNSETTYYIKVYDYNGSGTQSHYLMTGPEDNVTTLLLTSEPSGAGYNLRITDVTSTSFRVRFSYVDAERGLIVASTTGPITDIPQDGVWYNEGDEMAPGVFVVYNGFSLSPTISSFAGSALVQGTTYYVAEFEFNGSGTLTNYITTSFPTASTTTSSARMGSVEKNQSISEEEPVRGGTDLKDGFSNVFEVYPNPTIDGVNYSFVNGTIDKLEVLNMEGNTIYENHFAPSEGYIDLAGLNSGLYIIYIYMGESVESFKVIKQ